MGLKVEEWEGEREAESRYVGRQTDLGRTGVGRRGGDKEKKRGGECGMEEGT